jgi:olefin beta-lactone synthetase
VSAESGIVHGLWERSAGHPDRVALVGIGPGAGRLTFAELAHRVAAAGRAMRQDGIEPGDRVLILVPMSIELYVSLLGVLHAGATAVFVDAWAGLGRVEAAIGAAQPRAFLGSPRAHLLRLVSPALRRVPVKRLVRRGAFRSTAPGVPPRHVQPEDPALVTFTTGSTGAPRAAIRSHAFLWAQHQALTGHLGVGSGDVDLPTLPVFVLNNLASGATTVLPDFDPRHPARIRPARILAQMKREGVTTSSGSPAFYEALARHCLATGDRIPLRELFTGGAPVTPPLAALLQEATAGRVHVVYGSTEAEPVSGISTAELLRLDGTGEGLCVGRPVPEIRARIVRAHDGPITLDGGRWDEWAVRCGEGGELLVAGKHVLPGYYGDPGAERLTKVVDGETVWHRTGDGARLDEEGRLWLLGRVSTRVEVDGRTWWSLPAELRALRFPGVRHAAYLSVPTAAGDPLTTLCLESDGPVDASAARAALAPWPVDSVRTLSRIPRDPRHASKTDATRLRRLLEGR